MLDQSCITSGTPKTSILRRDVVCFSVIQRIILGYGGCVFILLKDGAGLKMLAVYLSAKLS